MPPIRRYLRITRFSVLEVRIYLESPALAETWLLSARSPALPRIMQAVRPLVLPKLREEHENARKKGGKKKRATKDVVRGDDFDVSVFLTETGAPHTLLSKRKSFGPEKGRLKGGDRMGIARYMSGGGGEEDPLDVDAADAPVLVREESDEDGVRMADIPLAPQRGGTTSEAIEVDSDEDGLPAAAGTRPGKRKRNADDAGVDLPGEGVDEKKKDGLRTEYEGFSIYGRILCLVVTRKGGPKARAGTDAGGTQMLENWVSTQADKDGVGVDEDG